MKMSEELAKKEWHKVDEYARDMLLVLHKAGNDCKDKPHDECQKDAALLDEDIKKLFGSVKAKDAKATEAELKFLIAEMPKFEEDCKLQGQCK